MRIIGLTGGIASGKSSVARLLEQLGASVVDADQLARDAVMPGTPAYLAIVELFGSEIVHADGYIDRERLGRIVFSDSGARKRLEAVVHPAIKDLAEERLSALRNAGDGVAVYMAPLLVEAGAVDRVDEVWVVYLDSTSQLERLMQRDHLSREAAQQRIASQLPMEEKRKYGKIVINNSGPWEETERQVREVWQREVVAAGTGN
ncbi:dephospho-CoA kinase [Geobacter pelophilus]|uniref:Dephospho-CoA kinase n=1 Tax=Geoanaerobacter pelophilus TaxID=60036 RepID=A0AAW4KZW3_9BACT|nr:dephospho-CoA kinase [Geoanaerobacter pelophilus]MBT0663467.1 dephospho-CoA kinase [Geoanaerobacter pelophilus]